MKSWQDVDLNPVLPDEFNLLPFHMASHEMLSSTMNKMARNLLDVWMRGEEGEGGYLTAGACLEYM